MQEKKKGSNTYKIAKKKMQKFERQKPAKRKATYDRGKREKGPCQGWALAQ